MTQKNILRPLTSGLLGITLMLPATWFLLTLFARLCFGIRSTYYYIAPSFLQSPFDLFAFHKAQFIIGCLLLAAVCNALAIFRFRLLPGPWGPLVQVTRRPYWLNTAIMLQSLLLLLVLIAYTLIQHLRY